MEKKSLSKDRKKQLKDIFKYQRAIVIQTSVIRGKIGPALYELIDKGKIHELQRLDILETFLSVYPKDDEVKMLYARMKSLGVNSFYEALKRLDCGKAEEFALQLLTYKCNLKSKAQILNKIINQSPQLS